MTVLQMVAMAGIGVIVSAVLVGLMAFILLIIEGGIPQMIHIVWGSHRVHC